MLAKTLVAAALVVAGTCSAHAGLINNQLNQQWASFRDQTSAQFSAKFTEMSAAGYRMIDIDAYPNGSGVLYSQIWEKNSDTRGWVENRDLSLAGFNSRHAQLSGQGYRLHDFESDRIGSGQRYAAIWVANSEGWTTSFAKDLTSSQYATYFAQQNSANRRPVDLEVYATSGGLRYAAIWYPEGSTTSWVQLRDMSATTYQTEVDEQADAGYRMIDFESYQNGSTQRYAAIWERNPAGRAYAIRSNLSELSFANLFRTNADLGLRLVDFERYDTSNGARYSGVWVENVPARYDYPRKGRLDAIVQAYRLQDPNVIPDYVPGISVAAIFDGTLIYRRGFGYADVNDGKVAHGETVYNAASVSKVIGGTLAAKLEAEDRLADGTVISLDLTRQTRTFLLNVPVGGGNTVDMPPHHTHRVEQLLAHLGCVPYYNGTTPVIPNTTANRVDAITAARNFWQVRLIQTLANGNACTVGTIRSYSSAAFTFVAAVLERVTGRNIRQLVREEITERYGLSSMRVQFETSSLPANYERAAPYDNNGNEGSYQNNSWKILGGGIETNAVDLASFGWKVLSGQIVSASVRDNRLFAPVRTNCGTSTSGACHNGLAWERTSANGRSVVEHGGSWSGARSFLRLYRRSGQFDTRPQLVIAIMFNRSGVGDAAYDIDTLATRLATAILEDEGTAE